jgi:hypothetical protein
MAQSKIFTGARAKVTINGKVVGLFSNASWSIRQEKAPQFILGRYNPAEITPTTQEAVQLTLTGYRVIDAGPYAVAGASHLYQLLTEEDFSVSIEDRQLKKSIFQANGCRVTGWSSGAASRGVSDIRVDIIGTIAWDESVKSDEDTGAVNLTDGSTPG